jgi:stage II sporulation protein D
VTPPAGATTAVAPTGRSYRGSVVALAREGFRLVNVLDVEDYLRGMGEVPAGWPAAALRTQAVAARTYALRAVAAGHPLGYDVCDDTRCQVYLGVQAEAASTTAAARATRGEVITYGDALADTFYSANAGGVTATPGEGFGSSTTIPYLPGGVSAPGDIAAWRVTASPRDIAARLGYPGRLEALTVSGKGPSGRVTQLRLDGSAGRRELAGVDAARRLGLRSTLFTVTRTTGAAQALPAPATAPQLAPAQAATAVVVLPSVAPSPSSSSAAGVSAAASSPATQPLGWGEVAVATFLVVGLFAGVLARRARLARHAVRG